eukprot:511040-Prymnesium_polylepis.1
MRLWASSRRRWSTTPYAALGSNPRPRGSSGSLMLTMISPVAVTVASSQPPMGHLAFGATSLPAES